MRVQSSQTIKKLAPQVVVVSISGMATHSSILAWIIPWTEKPGGHSPWGHKESDTTEHARMVIGFN